MACTGAKANATRDRAIVALLTDRSLMAAAKRAGIAERTLRRWIANDEEFRAALAERAGRRSKPGSSGCRP